MEQKLYICYSTNTETMDLQTRKYEFIQKLFDVNESLFEKLETIINKEAKEEPQRISIEQYNKEIEESIAQIDKGEFYTHQEVGERIKQWGRK